MFVDSRLLICDNDAVAQALGNNIAPGSDVIDLTKTGLAIGSGEELELVIQVVTAFAGAGASVQYDLVSADNSALTVNRTVHASTGTRPVAAFSQGASFVLCPGDTEVFRQYVGLWVTVTGAALTAGAISAFITLEPAFSKAYPGVI